MAKRKKREMLVWVMWDRRLQTRLEDAVEALQAIAGDLGVILAAKKRRSAAAQKANATRKAARGNSPENTSTGLPARGKLQTAGGQTEFPHFAARQAGHS